MGTLPDVLQQLGVPLLLALQARELLQELDPQLLGELHLRDGTAERPGPPLPPAPGPVPTAPGVTAGAGGHRPAAPTPVRARWRRLPTLATGRGRGPAAPMEDPVAFPLSLSPVPVPGLAPVPPLGPALTLRGGGCISALPAVPGSRSRFPSPPRVC